MLILHAAAVRKALTMRALIEALAKAIGAAAREGVSEPPRLAFRHGGAMRSAVVNVGYLSGERPAVGFKWAASYPGNAERGLDCVQGLVVLTDQATGVPLALVEGGVLTELRTAGVSAVATRALARADAGDLAVVGAGAQARAHLVAMNEVRTLRRVRLWNRTAARAEAFRAWAGVQGWRVEVMPTARAAVDGADLVCTCTASPEALIEGAWLAPGAHVNAVGAYRPDERELDSAVIARAAAIVVDSRASARAEAGDLLLPLAEGVLREPFEPAELGEVLAGDRPGRSVPDDVTVFKSLGVGLQDVAAAAAAYTRARELGLGVEVRFP